MKKILGFTIIGGVLIFVLNLIAIKSAKCLKDESLYINGVKRELIKNDFKHDDNKINVLFMGTSEVYAAINPILFDSLNDFKTNSFNMGLMGMASDPAQFILKDYLDNNQPPEIIVMEMVSLQDGPFRAFGKYSVQGMRYPDELFSYFIHKKEKSFLINILFPVKVYYKNLVKYLYCLVYDKDKLKMELKNKRKLKERLIRQRGFIVYGQRDEFLSPKEMKKLYPEKIELDIGDPSKNKIIKEFFDITQKIGIKVILLTTAKNELKYLSEIPYSYHKEVNYFLEKYDNVSLYNNTHNLIIYPNRFFVDQDHLNAAGNDKFTRHFAEVMKDIYLKEFQFKKE